MKSEDVNTGHREIIDLAYELLNQEKSGKGRPLYTDELMFTLPLIKKALSLYAAIESELESKRLVSSSALARVLIEVIVTYIFVSYIEKPKGFYEKFYEHNRLRRKRKGNGWEKITIASQISWIEENFKITKLQDTYDNYSEFIHYSPQNIQLILDRRSQTPELEGIHIIISSNEEHAPDELFQRVHVTADVMMELLKIQLSSEVRNKKLKVSTIKDVEVDPGTEEDA